jgi:predicted Zn-dependent protease
MGFLRFSRGMERQADRLGLAYLHRAGYDPAAFLDFLERIESLEKKKPGAVAGVFSSHPPTKDRIKRVQEQIEADLAAHPEYIVDTSEFHNAQKRLAVMSHRRKGRAEDPNRPTLRRRTTQDDEDERPTLKRRDD